MAKENKAERTGESDIRYPDEENWVRMAINRRFYLLQPVQQGPQGKGHTSGDWENEDLSLRTIPGESYTQTNDVSDRAHASKYHYAVQRIQGPAGG